MTKSQKELMLKQKIERLEYELNESKKYQEETENALIEIATLVDTAISEHEDALVELATMFAEME